MTDNMLTIGDNSTFDDDLPFWIMIDHCLMKGIKTHKIRITTL